MSAATQNEMERLRKERDEAFARGKQAFDDLRRVEADRKNRVESLERLRKKAAALTAQVARLTEQRDALAVHVEQQGDLLADSASWLDHARVFISTRQKMHEAGREGVEECLLRIAESRSNAPATSLVRRDAALMRRLADQLEEAEAPDAEGGDMWDASQCADWIREQAGQQDEGGES